MKAEVKRFHSPDISDVESFKPVNKKEFGFLLQVIIGIKGVDSEESFDMIVCTPRWLEKKMISSNIIFGEHYLLVIDYNFNRIKSKILDYIDNLDEDNWELLASKIDRIGKWEFRDYQE